MLILGVPRSGTTWVEHVLGASPGVRVVHEPDNETETPWPLVAKVGLGRFPLLDTTERAPRYELLWRAAFSGGDVPLHARWAQKQQQRHFGLEVAEATSDPDRRVPFTARLLAMLARPRSTSAPGDCVLVKSVHAVLCGAWLRRHFAPTFLIVHRDPLEVVASWRAMAARTEAHGAYLEYAGRPARLLSPAAMGHLSARYGSPPRESADAITWLAGSLMSELHSFARRSSDVTVLDFDAACLNPVGTLAAAAESAGLPWTRDCERQLDAFDRQPLHHRVAERSKLVPGAWRRRLPEAEVNEIEAGLRRFDLLASGKQVEEAG